MGNMMFDTNRFIENTSVNQMKNGTIQFMDTYNPGVYYTAHRNGTVNRVIKTNETIITHDGTNTTQQNVRMKTEYNRINYRPSSNRNDFVRLYRLSDQLGRIQEVAAYYQPRNNKTMNVSKSDSQTIITTPR